MQQDLNSSLNAQIQILTWVMGVGTVMVGALLAYVKVSTSNAINAAKLEIKEDVTKAKDSIMREIKSDYALKELVTTQWADLNDRLKTVERWRENELTKR